MNNPRKIPALVLTLSMLFAFTACSKSGGESTNESSQSIEEQSESSDNNSSATAESSSTSSTESTHKTPGGTPTIFIGPDGNPIYDSEITKLTSDVPDFNKKAAELTAEDERVTVFCEGFQYFKEPVGAAYNSYQNPEMFDGFEFKGEIPENKNEWKRVYVGEEICGLKLKSAASAFNNHSKDNFEKYQTYYTTNVADFDLYAEFEGSVTLTGYLNSTSRNLYEPDGGTLKFTPAEDKLPIMCRADFKIRQDTYSVAMSFGAGELYAFNEINQIDIDNTSGLDLGCVGIGDTAFVRLTLTDIKYYGSGIVGALSDIEILSDVLAHEEDSV